MSSVASSSKRGPRNKLQRAQAEAASDEKQQSLATLFQFGKTSARAQPKPGKAGAAAGLLHRPQPRKFKLPPEQGDSVELEVRSCINDLVAKVVSKHKVTDDEVNIECRNTLNTIIERVELNPPSAKRAVDDLRPKRQSYKNKAEIINVITEEMATGVSQNEAVKRLKTVQGYENVTSAMLTKWKKQGANKPRGRKPHTEFETAVISELVYTRMELVDNVEKAIIEANVVHSYLVIKQAAQKVQKTPAFLSDEKVQKFSFSDGWVQNFLRRSALRRRRVTAKDKKLPSLEDVRARMSKIQLTISGFKPGERVSADETGVFFGAPPKHQYVDASAERASAPDSDEKARFTSLLWGTPEEMGPSFNIIKMTVKGPDLSSSTVLKSLHEQTGFRASDGWELKTWQRKLSLPVRGKKDPVEAMHVRPYLYHTKSMTVITIQIKAWMDSAGICMWADVQLGPYFKQRSGRCVVVWDNCGSHNVSAVQEVFKEWSIVTENLPPNMTDLLQVMDLVVNGPVKAGIRRERIAAIFEYFQNWKIKRLQHDAVVGQDKPPPAFQPPKPKVAEGLRTLLNVLDGSLSTKEFKASLRKCFVEVGLLEDDNKCFKQFHFQKKGFLTRHIPQVQSPSDTGVSVGEIASEVALTSRPTGEDEDAESGNDEDEGSDDE